MDTPTAESPASTWQLDASESYVLLNGPEVSGTEAFRLAVTELVARGALRVVDVEQPSFLGQTGRTTVLVHGDTTSLPAEGPLRSVWELYEQTAPTTFPDGTGGVPVAQLSAAAQARYDTLDGFVRDEIMPDLERRGLYMREHYRVLRLFPATRWRLTPDGYQARAELERLMAHGDQRFGGWASNDPGQALAFMALAGSAMLLMGSSYPDLHRLHGMGDPGTSSLNFDPVAFESLNTTFSAIDAGTEAAGLDDAGGADLDADWGE